MSEYELTRDDIDAIRDQLEHELDIAEDDIRTDYSGRGMYGTTCLGFVGHDCTRFAFELALVIARGEVGNEDGDDDGITPDDIRNALADIGRPDTDSMGYQTIFYWRNITVEPDEVLADDQNGIRL